jgi:hypothetical protein
MKNLLTIIALMLLSSCYYSLPKHSTDSLYYDGRINDIYYDFRPYYYEFHYNHPRPWRPHYYIHPQQQPRIEPRQQQPRVYNFPSYPRQQPQPRPQPQQHQPIQAPIRRFAPRHDG